MGDINLVVVAGNVVRDPDLRYTPSGTAICDFTIANNETWFDKNSQEKKEKVHWINCFCWGKRGEVIAEYVKKGSKFQVQGKLSYSEWEDKDGNKRNAIKVNVTDFSFMGGNKGGGGQKAGDTSNPNSYTPTSDKDIDDVPDEDIPF